jgi:hypothetical protein
MVSQDSLLVTLVELVDRLPMPALPSKRGRGHPQVYTSYLGTPNVRTPGDAPCPNWLSGSPFGGPDSTVADVWASGC